MTWEPMQPDAAVIMAASTGVIPNHNRVTMIGRPQAGKSLLVGALLRQGRNSVHSFDDYQPLFFARADPDEGRNDTAELISLINLLVQGQSFPATYTHRILNYHVRLECERTVATQTRSRWSWSKLPAPERALADIAITDAAGGLIMGPDTGNQERDLIQRVVDFTQIVRSSRGLIYCLPADMTELDLAAEHKQMTVIDDLILRNEIDLERIVVVLTKYESLWAGYGTGAYDCARDLDAFKQVAAAKLPAGLRKSLVALAGRKRSTGAKKPIEVCIAPASAFGFVKGNGCVNFNGATGRLLVESGERGRGIARSSVPMPYYTDSEAIDYWQPFHIVDPFIYAAFGDKGRLTVDVRELE